MMINLLLMDIKSLMLYNEMDGSGRSSHGCRKTFMQRDIDSETAKLLVRQMPETNRSL
jgi:hypothetical protein